MNLPLLINSLLLATGTTAIAVALGWVAAVWWLGLGRPARRWLFVGAVLAFALPPFLVVNGWMDLVGLNTPLAGWLPLRLSSLGGATAVMASMFWPLPFLWITGAWQRLASAQLELEPDLRGAALFRWWLWPAGRGAAGQAAAITFVLALNHFAVPALLQVKVYPVEIWIRFTTQFDTLGALAASWPLALAAAVLLWLCRHPEVSWPRTRLELSPRLFRQRLGRVPWRLACLLTLVGLAASLLPLLRLLASDRTWSQLGPVLNTAAGPWLHSFLLAAAAATLALALGLCAWRWHLGSLLWFPFLLPGVLLGIGCIQLFNRPALAWFSQSLGIVVLAWTIRYLAVTWTTARRGLQAVDRTLADAARLEGASRWQRFRLVDWPQAGALLAAGWYLVFLLCLWDTETLVLIQPPGAETLGLRIFNFLHYGHNAQVNALCLLLLLTAATPILLAWAWCRFRPAARRLALVGPLLLAGCTPASNSEAPVQSRIFSHVRVLGTRGNGLGQFNKPRSVAVDAQDNLYVVDMTGRVQKFSPAGEYLAYWQMPETDLGKPKGMCRDEHGHIVVIEPHYSRVNHFSPAGNIVEQWGRPGTNAGEFTFPRAVAVSPAGDAFVSEYAKRERVQRFSQSRQLLCEIGSAGRGPGQFDRPEGLGLDAAGRLYVADSCNHRIQVFGPDGKFQRSYGTAGTGPGELSYPYDVCVDPAGRQFVCEFGNSRIQVFDPNGRSLETLGGLGSAPGQLSNPWSIALDSRGNLYVADAMNHRVQKFVRRSAALVVPLRRLPSSTLLVDALGRCPSSMPLVGRRGYARQRETTEGCDKGMRRRQTTKTSDTSSSPPQCLEART